MKSKYYFLMGISLIFLLSCNEQTDSGKDTCHYIRSIKNVQDKWHEITLPDSMVKKVKDDLSDLGILGIKKNGDTIEVPYIVKPPRPLVKNNKSIEIINKSKVGHRHFFTFAIDNPTTINNIETVFSNNNFDWLCTLEGSNDNTQWYEILNDYRILSIVNAELNFHYTKLTFSKSNYKYYRLAIDSKDDPLLTTAFIHEYENNIQDFKPVFKPLLIKSMVKKYNKQNRETEVDVLLNEYVPIDCIKINVQDRFDYFRNVTIEGLKDSVKTEKGWIKNYFPLYTGVLNSLDSNAWHFESSRIQKLRIRIHDGDNEPLSIGTLELAGPTYILQARFIEKASYFMTYGNKHLTPPNYDISKFRVKIPENLSQLSIGEEQSAACIEIKLNPLFEDKIYLWLIMMIIILLLGYFTMLMIKSKQ